jgi:predicted metallo-beta-lactamase superfamily hydrolase
MGIEILGTESLGVRGLSCVVEACDRSIIIDPGIALGYQRHSLLPHPFQVAAGENVRRKIVKALKECTDIVISHFHGDHVPLANANPFQLSAKRYPAIFGSLSCGASVPTISHPQCLNAAVIYPGF